MRRSLSQIQESGGRAWWSGGMAGGGGGGAGRGGARASAGSVLRRRTLPRFLSMVACTARHGARVSGARRGRHGPAALAPPDPRLLFFSIVACRTNSGRSRPSSPRSPTPRIARPAACTVAASWRVGRTALYAWFRGALRRRHP